MSQRRLMCVEGIHSITHGAEHVQYVQLQDVFTSVLFQLNQVLHCSFLVSQSTPNKFTKSVCYAANMQTALHSQWLWSVFLSAGAKDKCVSICKSGWSRGVLLIWNLSPSNRWKCIGDFANVMFLWEFCYMEWVPSKRKSEVQSLRCVCMWGVGLSPALLPCMVTASTPKWPAMIWWFPHTHFIIVPIQFKMISSSQF